MPLLRSALRASVLALVLAAAPVLAEDQPASSPHNVPEPAGLYQGAPHGYVPATIKGGRVLDTKALEELVKAEKPILIDVAEKDRKPPSMAKEMLWLPQHRSIPGAVWWPGAGTGTDDRAFADAFGARAKALTDGKLDKQIVVFCHPDCWGSYNAAKRLIGLGYSRVNWYPAGMEGWQELNDTAIIKPDEAWEASLSKVVTQ